jgi:hypothetical protein
MMDRATGTKVICENDKFLKDKRDENINRKGCDSFFNVATDFNHSRPITFYPYTQDPALSKLVGKDISPRIICKNERKTSKCNKYACLFTESSRTDANYSYSIKKLL